MRDSEKNPMWVSEGQFAFSSVVLIDPILCAEWKQLDIFGYPGLFVSALPNL